MKISKKKKKSKKRKKKEDKDVVGRIAGREGEGRGTEGSHKETTAGGAAVAVDPSPGWFQK